MSTFLYFLPGTKERPTPAQIETAGLSYAFDRAPDSNGCESGPGGARGVILAQPTDGPIGYYPAKQTWRKIPKLDAWVGFVTENRPGPADLMRAAPYPHNVYRLPLADGNTWRIPVVCEPLDLATCVPAVPCRVEVDEEGELIQGPPLDQYTDLWLRVGHYFDEWAEHVGTGVDWSWDIRHEDVIALLAATYRIGLIEAVILGLWQHCDNRLHDVILLAIDSPGWFAMREKKRASAESSTSAGAADS